jgi:hypothetical protein
MILGHISAADPPPPYLGGYGSEAGALLVDWTSNMREASKAIAQRLLIRFNFAQFPGIL